MELLLKRGADVNAQGGFYGHALRAVSRKGNERVVKLLLDGGAGVNAQGGFYGYDFKETIAEPRQQRRADINTQGGVYGNASEETLTRKWQQREADVNTQRLQPASYKGRTRVILRSASESKTVLNDTTRVPIPEASGNDSSGSAYEINSDGSVEIHGETSDSTATGDNSSRSGSSLMSDEDEVFESGDTTLPEYDSPLASLRDRISKPVEYFDRLKTLAHLIYQHSTLHAYSKTYSPRMAVEKITYSDPFPGYPDSLKELTPDIFEPIPDSDVMRTCRDVSVTHNAFASDLLEILECRNVSAQTYMNLRRLQLHGFCSQKFSILTIDPYRYNVARLLPIDVQQILELLKEIELVLKKVANFARHDLRSKSSPKVLFEQALGEQDYPLLFGQHNLPSKPSAKGLLEQALGEQDDLLLCVPRCMEFLIGFGLVLANASHDRIHLSISATLRLVVSTVDLAVTSYSGAHVSRFDQEYLGEDIAVIDVLGPFPSLNESQIPLIKLSRCQLQCLDAFHNSQPVWVFSSNDWKPRGHLFLATKVEDFADIWGPLWRVIDPQVPNLCARYAVGNGCIYKWNPQKATPRLLEYETLCHWISNPTIEARSDCYAYPRQPVFPDIVDGGFNGNETLLIGAVAAGCERLTLKKDCNFNLEKERSALDHDGRVQMLGTVKEHTYKDSETYQLQAGHGGLSASASKQYKRWGQSLKQAFVELWTTTPELRDPRLLQDFYGLEVSLCTQNAQRIQLGRILGLGSMCQYLRTFTWTTDCAKKAYFDALKGFREDDDALQKTWERHDQYQEDFGRAVLVCLKALEKTGINHKGQLSALLSSEITARPELIAMESKEHSWIGLLKDSENSCCMAVIGDDCLEFKNNLGSTCGRTGCSVLRTALMINGRNKPRGVCKKHAYTHEATDGWTSRWSVRNMEINSDVRLGKHGTLRLLSHLPEGTLLVDWRASAPPFITAMKSLIDKERPHREYSENIRKEARHTRPIPLFVMSNS